MYPQESKTKRLGRKPILCACFAIFDFYVVSQCLTRPGVTQGRGCDSLMWCFLCRILVTCAVRCIFVIRIYLFEDRDIWMNRVGTRITLHQS